MKKTLIFSICLLLLCSCVPKEKMLYLQDLESNYSKQTMPDYKLTIQPDDELRIVLSCKNMELLQPYVQVLGATRSMSTQVNGQGQLQTYLVNSEGWINFPVLGRLEVVGKTRVEVEDMLSSELSKVVSNVTVDVRIMNFSYSVLGQVESPGTFTAGGNRVTILNALSRAGDIGIYGSRKDIILIREVDQERKVFVVDITDPDLLNREYYFIRQNDTIVVDPNNAQIQSAGINRNLPVWISLASTVLSMVVVLTNLSNR